MQEHRTTSSSRQIDWGLITQDYSQYRPGPPESFYDRLREFDIGMPQQKILDLGTGTGVLARRFARSGSNVTAIDLSPAQIAAAKHLAQDDFVDVEFRVCAAEETPFANQSFDVITANQCWRYFDQVKAIAEVKRLLSPEGRLVTSHFSWLPRLDRVAAATEELILKYNPRWTGGDWSGTIAQFPQWAQQDFELDGMFFFDEPVPFTHETWRGRVRASRGVGAALTPSQIKQFDRELIDLLEGMVARHFVVRHRIDAHIYAVRPPTAPS